MKYTESDKDQIEAILYYQYRIDKAIQELLSRHTVKGVVQKLAKVREERAK
jgi:hypothetical protein